MTHSSNLNTNQNTRTQKLHVRMSARHGKGKGGRGGGKGGKRIPDDEMIAQLTERIAVDTPASGTNPLADRMRTDVVQRFDQLPLSERTLQGLKKGGYESMKDIQAACIPHLLAGRDLMGAAKTGSGKTLAFLVPAMEKLYRQHWSSLDGLGALVISPTRELAIQIFDVLKKVGSFHEMSAGLIIGGKDVAQEHERVTRMNVLVCTPGRLLQHMDETYGFECSALQVLVLDEADRILDMGFSATLNSIIQNLPKERQTVLFSATLSKSVKDLARLSMRSPEYIALHEAATFQTPTRLQQHYMVMDCSEKLDALWSFIKTHLKQKTIVFFSSCNQVKFVHEVFCRMRPGIVLSALHGKVKQEKRLQVCSACSACCHHVQVWGRRRPGKTATVRRSNVSALVSQLPCFPQIFMDFCSRKEAVLFATDVAGRGLDFPEVDWVIQVDCPEVQPPALWGHLCVHQRGQRYTTHYTLHPPPEPKPQTVHRPPCTLQPTPEPTLSTLSPNSSPVTPKPFTLNPNHSTPGRGNIHPPRRAHSAQRVQGQVAAASHGLGAAHDAAHPGSPFYSSASLFIRPPPFYSSASLFIRPPPFYSSASLFIRPPPFY